MVKFYQSCFLKFVYAMLSINLRLCFVPALWIILFYASMSYSKLADFQVSSWFNGLIDSLAWISLIGKVLPIPIRRRLLSFSNEELSAYDSSVNVQQLILSFTSARSLHYFDRSPVEVFWLMIVETKM